MKKLTLAIWILMMGLSLLAQQQERQYIRKGNQLYSQGRLPEAESMYDQALDTKSDMIQGVFNKGNVYFQQDSFKKAAQQFELAANMAENDSLKAGAFHNMGNSLMNAADYEGAVEAYKNALRKNPNDQNTRYNLSYAMTKLKEQEQQNQDQDKKQEKDEGEDKDKSKQNQKQENDPNQEDKPGQKQEEEQQDPKQGDKGNPEDAKKGEKGAGEEDMPVQPREGQLSKEEALRLLEALQNEEEKVQLKLQKQEQQNNKKQDLEKDW